jgi:uncharacterized protein YjbI with pentapeptide repeats
MDLRGVDLTDSSLRGSSLVLVYLANAKMNGADLRDATLDRVETTGADLTGANLERIKYDQFTLYSLSDANLDGAKISDDLKADLSRIKEVAKAGSL